MLNLTNNMRPPNNFPILFRVNRLLSQPFLKILQLISNMSIRNGPQQLILINDFYSLLKNLLLTF